MCAQLSIQKLQLLAYRGTAQPSLHSNHAQRPNNDARIGKRVDDIAGATRTCTIMDTPRNKPWMHICVHAVVQHSLSAAERVMWCASSKHPETFNPQSQCLVRSVQGNLIHQTIPKLPSKAPEPCNSIPQKYGQSKNAKRQPAFSVAAAASRLADWRQRRQCWQGI
jgi:hypothetical protein